MACSKDVCQTFPRGPTRATQSLQAYYVEPAVNRQPGFRRMAVSSTSTSSSSSRQHHDEHGHGHANGHCSIGSVSHCIIVSLYHFGLHMLRNNKTLSSTSYTSNYVVGVGRVGAGLGPDVVVGRRVPCILRLVGALHQLSSLWLSFASSLPSSS